MWFDLSYNTGMTALILTAALVFLWISAASPQNPVQSASAAGSACSAPRKYVKLINDGKYDSVGSLFADNAAYMGPDGELVMARGYRRLLLALLAKTQAPVARVEIFQQGNECMMELENKSGQTGEFAPAAVDHFTIDSAGKDLQLHRLSAARGAGHPGAPTRLVNTMKYEPWFGRPSRHSAAHTIVPPVDDLSPPPKFLSRPDKDSDPADSRSLSSARRPIESRPDT